MTRIDTQHALTVALIDAIEHRSALAAGDSERRGMHQSYVDAYRTILKQRTGSDRTPMERAAAKMTMVSIWPKDNRK